jgi:sec-independent protein translocase protein TatA
MTEPHAYLMIGMPNAFELVLIVLVIVLLFGKGKISDLMTDFAKGIKSFKKGISDEEEAGKAQQPPSGKIIDGTVVAPKEDVHTPSGTQTKA